MFKKFFKKNLKSNSNPADRDAVLTREMLVKKVDKGTDRALKEYVEVFKKLAEYDRT